MTDSEKTEQPTRGYAHRLLPMPSGEKRCVCGYTGPDVLDHIQAENNDTSE